MQCYVISSKYRLSSVARYETKLYRLVIGSCSDDVTDSLTWSKPALGGTAPLPRSLHSATTIKNK